MPRRSASRRVVWFALRAAALGAAIARSIVDCSPAYAVTTNWIANSGVFTQAANWDNGVPDSDDVAVFNRGFVAYEVNFPGGLIFDPPVIYAIGDLRVHTNEVGFVFSPVPFQRSPGLSVLGLSIVVGENDGDVAILNMALASLTGANASIGRAFDAQGVLNVGGTFSISGALDIGDLGIGTMNVTAGGRVESFNCNIGHLSSGQGHATISGAGSTWANSGNLTVGNAGVGFLDITDGSAVSTNTATLGATGSGFFTGGAATVTGAGSTWTISDALTVGRDNSGSLTINAGGSVSSTDGFIGGGFGDPISESFVLVKGAGSTWTTARLSIGSAIEGNGRLDIEPGGIVSVAQDVLIFPEGSIRLQGGTLDAQSVSFQDGGQFQFNSGTLHVGVYNGDLANIGGVLAPGRSPGITSVIGSYTQLNDATLQIELGGLMRGTAYDAVVANGQIALDGTLQVVLTDDFMPTAGNSFDILDWGSLSGTFSTLQLPSLAAGLGWNTSQLYVSGVLSVGIAGDYNGNGEVDAADYVVWRKNEGTSNSLPNDPIGGTIGPAQYDLWRANFGRMAGSGSGAAAGATVPEPTALAILLVSSLCLGCRRPRRT